MPGGKRPSNPAELLSSQRFADLLGALREKFDVIIVDTPPLLAVSDPSAIAAVVDGVVLTIRLRRNVMPLVTRAARILESVDSKLLGIVVNGVSQDAGYGYNYGYRDYRYQYSYGSKGYTNKGYYGNSKYLEKPTTWTLTTYWCKASCWIKTRTPDPQNTDRIASTAHSTAGC